MQNRRRTAALLGLACSFAVGPLGAQRKNAPVNAAGAPVPVALLQGKRAFVSFELGDVSAFPSVYSGGPERAYAEFYRAMQQWGHYQLVADPKAADLVLGIRFVETPGLNIPQIRLGITDAATHVSLWAFSEEINGALLKRNRDPAFSDAVGRVVADLKLLLTSNGEPQQP